MKLRSIRWYVRTPFIEFYKPPRFNLIIVIVLKRIVCGGCRRKRRRLNNVLKKRREQQSGGRSVRMSWGICRERKRW